MKLTRKQVYDLFNGLNGVSKLGGVKFSYAVARNIAKLQSEINSLKVAFDAKEEYIKYDQLRDELAKKHAVKENGVPKTVIDNGVQIYVFEDKEAFNKDLFELKKEYAEVIKARENQLKEFDELLKTELEVNLYTIPSDYLPEQITAEQTLGILPIIEEK